jgi:aldose 1-epimerase
MQRNKKFCCQHFSGEDIYLFTLRNVKGTEVSITNYGAIITLFKILQKNGTVNDIVLGFDNTEDYLSPAYHNQYPYFGAAIGRYGNRIKNGQFKIDGKIYQLTRNMGTDNLHGGFSGFDKKVWQVISLNEKENILEFRCQSPDGEDGFPGNLETTIRFQLSDDDELSYEFSATTDKPTAVNLTHHSYFNLDNQTGTIVNHLLKIYSPDILAQDEGLTATGQFIPVENTVYDFREFRRINFNWNPEQGYDQSFVVENKETGLSLMAEAFSDKSEIKLEVFSTEPVVHLYTGQGIPSLRGKNKINYGPYSGFCLETQKHPNAINIPHFPDTVLKPGEVYTQKTVYRVSETDVK